MVGVPGKSLRLFGMVESELLGKGLKNNTREGGRNEKPGRVIVMLCSCTGETGGPRAAGAWLGASGARGCPGTGQADCSGLLHGPVPLCFLLSGQELYWYNF